MKIVINRNILTIFGLASLLTFVLFTTSVYAPTSETGNTTLNASVVVFVDIIPSTQLDTGIFFGAVDSNTIGNPAQNNTNCAAGTCYNISVDSGSNVNIDFYHDLTAVLAATMYVNESASTTSNTAGFTTNTTVATSYSIIGNTTVNCTAITASNNCWIKYYLDVASGTSGGAKTTTYEYCGVETGQGSGDCT